LEQKTAVAKKTSPMLSGSITWLAPKMIRISYNFLYDFVEDYRCMPALFHSASIIFNQPQIINEELFEELLWRRPFRPLSKS